MPIAIVDTKNRKKTPNTTISKVFSRYSILNMEHKNKILILIVLLTMWIGAYGQDSILYGIHGGKKLYLDIHKPQSPRTDKACVVYVFGGGFHDGARNNQFSLKCAEALTRMGYTAITIDYRLGMTDSVFARTKLPRYLTVYDTAITWAVEDCSAAIRWIVDHATEIDIDPTKIILTGSSAGAITVLQTDYSRCNKLPASRELPAGWKPAAVVSYAGAIYTRYGKIRYKEEPAPTCMFHGTIDGIVSYKHYQIFRNHWGGSKYLAKQFKKNDYPHWILRFTDRGHEVALYLPATTQEFEAFTDGVLNGRRTHYDATCEDEALQQTSWSKAKLWHIY